LNLFLLHILTCGDAENRDKSMQFDVI